MMGALNDLKKEITPIYQNLESFAVYDDCPRCIGKGDISAFRHVKGGICFKCKGSKKTPKNKAAKLARRLSYLYSSVRNSWHLGIREIECLESTKEIRKLISELPGKYTKGVNDNV